MAEVVTIGSELPGGFVVGRALPGEPVAAVFEALPAAGEGRRGRAVVLHPMFEAALSTWFQRTGVLLTRLSHPNIVEVYATGQTTSGLPVCVTEWLEGPTLRQRLRDGPLAQDEAIRVLRSVAAALDYLHARSPSVLHRALTPDHVRLLEPDHRVKLLAVGDADRFDPPAAPPRYLSPEELDGDPQALTPAADLFSLATLAFELLKGEPAFGPGADDVIDAVRGRALPRLARSPRDPMGDVDLVLEKAWSLDLAARPPTATDFVQAIRDVLDARKAQRGTPLHIVTGGTTQEVHMVEPEPARGSISEMPPPVPAPADHLRAPTLPGAPRPASVMRGATPVVRAPTPAMGVRVPTPAMGVRAPTPALGVRAGVPIGQAPLRAPTPALGQSQRTTEVMQVGDNKARDAIQRGALADEILAAQRGGFGAGDPTPYRGVPRVTAGGPAPKPRPSNLKATLDETPAARGRRPELKATLAETPAARARAGQLVPEATEAFFPEPSDASTDEPTVVDPPDDIPVPLVGKTKARTTEAGAPRGLAVRPAAADKPTKAPWDDHSFAQWKPPLETPEAEGRVFRFTHTHLAILLVALPLLVALLAIGVGRALR